MGIFIDKRLDARYEQICTAMQTRQSVILRKIARNRNEEIGLGRFLNNKLVSPHQMITAACKRTAELSKGRDVLLVEDTSTMGFGMFSKVKDLGRIGDGKAYGFFLHPVLSIDAQTGHCLGLASAQHYDRKVRQGSVAQRRRDRNRERLDQKESYRWYEEVERAVAYDQGANSYTVIADQEADIYELLALLSEAEIGFVIRNFQNRRLAATAPQNKIQDLLDADPVKGQHQLVLPATDKRSAHTAHLDIKWVESELARPSSGTGTNHLAERQPVTIVEIREQRSSVVGKEKPIHWRLLTSHDVHDLEDALRIIGYYVQRWVIEQVFRTLKKKGFDIYSAEVHNARALKNLTALCLINAVQVMQLVQARQQDTGLKIQDGFEPDVASVITRLSPSLEGNTQKLKNPHSPESMAFAAWVVARLGGWSGYASQRPPGPITMWDGLRRLYSIVEGVRILHPPNIE